MKKASLLKSPFTILLIISCLSFISCDIHTTPENLRIATERELLLARIWTYDSIVIEGRSFTLVTRTLEPRIFVNEFARSGADITRKHIKYGADYSYQFQWEPDGDYWFDPPYWQPSFGFWRLSEDEQLLIHSPLQVYQVDYEILELTEDRLVRRSDRIMKLTADTTLWQPGDTVKFYEYFHPKD